MGNKAFPSNGSEVTRRRKREAHMLLLRYSVNISVSQEERLAASMSNEVARALNLS